MVRRSYSSSRRLPLYRTVGRGASTRSGVAGSTRHVTTKGASEMPIYGRRPVSSGLVPTHFHDTPIEAGDVFKSDGTIFQINRTIVPGSGIKNYAGSRFYMTGLQIRGQAYAQPNTQYASSALMVVYDKRPRGAVPAITDILDTATPFAFQNISNRDRFEILYRKNFTTTGTTSVPTSDSIDYFDVSLKFKKLVSLTTDATDTSIGFMLVGALYVIYLGTGVSNLITPASSAAVWANIGYRIHFTDDE